MERICIIGGSETGKTTLANNLGKELDLPIYHIDGINYSENWEERDKKQRDEVIIEKVKQPRWVIDGTYRSTLQQRLEKADCVIYLDYSSLAQLRGVLKRFIQHHGKERSEIPGCKERINWKFLCFVIRWRKNRREEILEKISKVNNEKVYIFHNRHELNKWYKKNFNKKIEII